MTNRLDERIAQSLHTAADSSSRPPLELADHVVVRGRAVRRRRRASLAAAVAAVAIVVPVSLVASEGSVDKAPNPGGSPKPTPLPQSTVQSFRELPKGAPPQFPYVVATGRRGHLNGPIVDRSRTIRLPADRLAVPFAKLGSGYLVLLRSAVFTGPSDPNADLVLVSVDGHERVLAHGSIVSAVAGAPGSQQVFFAEESFGVRQGTGSIVRLNLTNGQQVAKTEVQGYNVRLVGWTTIGLLIRASAPAGNAEAAYLWSGRSTDMPRLLVQKQPVAVTQDGAVMLTQDGNDPRTSCSRLYDTASRRQAWQMCNFSPVALAPQGNGVLVEREGVGTLIIDVESGRTRALELPKTATPMGAALSQVRWEDDQRFEAVVYDGSVDNGPRGYIVRCNTVSGDCERALGPVTGDFALIS
jgi:hypothetical protein